MSSRIVPIEIQPVVLTTTDQKQRKLLLSAGGMNRLKKQFDVKTIKELLDKDEEVAAPILWEALLEKDLTEDAFYDVLPCNPQHIARAVALLLGASFPDPTPAAPIPTTETAPAVN